MLPQCIRTSAVSFKMRTVCHKDSAKLASYLYMFPRRKMGCRYFSQLVSCTKRYCQENQSQVTVISLITLFNNLLRRQFYSNLNNDEQLKQWLKEMQEDSDKEIKTVTDVCNDLGSESSANDSDGEDTKFNSLIKLGYTAEEIIEILKKAKIEHFNCSLKDIVSELTSKSIASSNEHLNQTEQDSKTKGILKGMLNASWAVVEMDVNTIDTIANKDDVQKKWSSEDIEDFVSMALPEPEVDTKTPAVDLVRGQTGVYDIEDLVKVLASANVIDLVTIHIPPMASFADYMVIVSAKSRRHLEAIAADVQCIYKCKKIDSDQFVKIEGKGSGWLAMDLGNIILHMFMPEDRELYDLETLWTIGPEYDSNCEEHKDPYTFSVNDLPWLKNLEQDLTCIARSGYKEMNKGEMLEKSHSHVAIKIGGRDHINRFTRETEKDAQRQRDSLAKTDRQGDTGSKRMRHTDSQ